MGRTFQQILIPFLCVLLVGCGKENPTPEQHGNGGGTPPIGNGSERNVYIACEGSFGNGNASLSVQDLNGTLSYDDVYFNTNNKSLGDVLQSIERIGDKLFLCVNNSDKIVVLDATTRKEVGVIDIPKPRYILPIDGQKAYVSTLYSNEIYIINPQTLSIKGTITMPAQNPESMIRNGNRVYVCNWDVACDKVYIVHAVTDQVADSYKIAGKAPHSIVEDDAGFVWVLSGNVQKGENAALTKLVPGGADIITSFQFQNNQDPIKLTTNKAKDVLYFIGVDYTGSSGYNGIYKMNTADGALPTSPLITAQKYQYYWGLAVDPVTDDIYVGDPKGFIQKGAVNVHDNNGNLKRSFDVGVGPGYFYFDE